MSELIAKLATCPSPATLQFDLAAAAIALIALIFSTVSYYQQRRISVEMLRIQRDNDIIGWMNQTRAACSWKRAFMLDAREEVRPQRRRDFLN